MPGLFGECRGGGYRQSGPSHNRFHYWGEQGGLKVVIFRLHLCGLDKRSDLFIIVKIDT